jgi:hypothetical protein
MDDELERQAWDVKQGKHFVNSFSFIFLEFLTKFYHPIFFTWAKNAKLVGHAKNRTEPASELGQADRPVPIGPGGPGGGSPPVSFGTRVFDFLVWSENFREVKKRKIRFLGLSFPGYLKGQDGSSGIHPNSHPFAPKQ